jgi:hypothetical protein
LLLAGADVVIFKIFSPKNLAKIIAVFAQATANPVSHIPYLNSSVTSKGTLPKNVFLTVLFYRKDKYQYF